MRSAAKLSMAAILALPLLGNAALAQSATQNINLSATVADYCSIGGAASGTAVNRSITVTNGTVSTSALSAVTVGSVVCTKISDVTLATTNTGLTTATAPNASFQNVIHYTAAASFAGATPSLDTSAATSATAATNTGANLGTLTVNITPQANTLPMLTGAYADVLVVTLTPQ
ncbi:MAG: hypothetical protein SFW09_18985 [Hyphomicrobiaceae bacterium]|nr:hypothetical protein [Hyphomicrobiaceae bacterium]